MKKYKDKDGEPKLMDVGTVVTINNYYNVETGELVETVTDVKHDKVVVNSRAAFFATYYNMPTFPKKLTGAEKSLMQFIAMNMAYNKNHFIYNSLVQKEIEGDSGLHAQTVRNCLASLSKAKVLIHLSRGNYRVNPKYYWKGDSHTRDKVLTYFLQVECRECNGESGAESTLVPKRTNEELLAITGAKAEKEQIPKSQN